MNVFSILSGPHKDKAFHFIAGGAVASIAGIFVSPVVAVSIALAVGIAKELYDKRSYGVFDAVDVAATVAGGVVGGLGHYFFH